MKKDMYSVSNDEYRVDQKTGIITRHPSLEEIKRLMEQMEKRGGVVIDLYKTPSWVAEQDGYIVGCIAAHLVFEVSSLPVQGIDILMKAEGRAEQLLFEACARWMRSDRNGIGTNAAICEVSGAGAKRTLARLGWKVRSFAKSKLFARVF